MPDAGAAGFVVCTGAGIFFTGAGGFGTGAGIFFTGAGVGIGAGAVFLATAFFAAFLIGALFFGAFTTAFLQRSSSGRVRLSLPLVPHSPLPLSFPPNADVQRLELLFCQQH